MFYQARLRRKWCPYLLHRDYVVAWISFRHSMLHKVMQISLILRVWVGVGIQNKRLLRWHTGLQHSTAFKCFWQFINSRADQSANAFTTGTLAKVAKYVFFLASHNIRFIGWTHKLLVVITICFVHLCNTWRVGLHNTTSTNNTTIKISTISLPDHWRSFASWTLNCFSPTRLVDSRPVVFALHPTCSSCHSAIHDISYIWAEWQDEHEYIPQCKDLVAECRHNICYGNTREWQ